SRPARARPRATGLVRLRRTDLAQAYLVGLIAAPPAPRAVLALSLAVEVVGADPDARLFQEIRERLGLGYELGAGVEHGRDWAVAVFSASAARDDERRLRETLDRTCREAATGFSADELRRARKKVRYRFARLADSRLDRALAHASRAAGARSLPGGRAPRAEARAPRRARADRRRQARRPRCRRPARLHGLRRGRAGERRAARPRPRRGGRRRRVARAPHRGPRRSRARLRLPGVRRAPARDRASLRRLRARGRPGRVGTLSHRARERAANLFRARHRRGARAEPDRRAAPARRGDAARGPRALDARRAARAPRADRLESRAGPR